jgi:hypothetical protein
MWRTTAADPRLQILADEEVAIACEPGLVDGILAKDHFDGGSLVRQGQVIGQPARPGILLRWPRTTGSDQGFNSIVICDIFHCTKRDSCFTQSVVGVGGLISRSV